REAQSLPCNRRQDWTETEYGLECFTILDTPDDDRCPYRRGHRMVSTSLSEQGSRLATHLRRKRRRPACLGCRGSRRYCCLGPWTQAADDDAIEADTHGPPNPRRRQRRHLAGLRLGCLVANAGRG